MSRLFQNDRLVWSLTADEIGEIISYLQNVQGRKLELQADQKCHPATHNRYHESRPHPNAEPAFRAWQDYRLDDKSQLPTNDDYYNRHEYGYHKTHRQPCRSHFDISRDVTAESVLRNPKIKSNRKKSGETAFSRFDYLHYNPQDTKHVVWSAGPRGGISTRT